MSAKIIQFPVERRKHRPASEVERLLYGYIERMTEYHRRSCGVAYPTTDEEARLMDEYLGKLIQ